MRRPSRLSQGTETTITGTRERSDQARASQRLARHLASTDGAGKGRFAPSRRASRAESSPSLLRAPLYNSAGLSSLYMAPPSAARHSLTPAPPDQWSPIRTPPTSKLDQLLS